MIKPVSYFKDRLKVDIFQSAAEMGAASANFVAGILKKTIDEKGFASLILGTGASQYPLHNELLMKDLDWKKITLFHLDEYIGIDSKHPASFRRFLRERIAEKILPGIVYYLNGDASDLDEEKKRYEALLRSNPVDVACIGIGENGHIAFNDPGVADFNDPEYIRAVKMDEVCRRQQVGEGWFPSLADVPETALTLTIPAIMDCRHICCTVPDERKSDAVYNTLEKAIDTSCPASVLRRHKNAVLFLDRFSAIKLPDRNHS